MFVLIKEFFQDLKKKTSEIADLHFEWNLPTCQFNNPLLSNLKVGVYVTLIYIF